MDTIKGLVDLMDAALATAPRFHAPALFLYGGKDELVPDRADRGHLAGAAGGERRGVLPGRLPSPASRPGARAPIADVIAWIRDPPAPLPQRSRAGRPHLAGGQD